MQKTPKHFDEIVALLDKYFPDPPIPLKHSDPYTLLVAVVLSAQCTDARVNATTPKLWELADNVYDMAKQSEESVLEIVRPCGLGPQKAKAVVGLSKIIVESHNGVVPSKREALEALPGVGRKTANVVLSHAFATPAFPVDTHIQRLANRWQWSEGRSALAVERDLTALFEPSSWERRHLQMIYFGREYCKAKAHKAEECPACKLFL
ncbi:MAG: endonuclease III [Bradymonadia bacterium]